MDGSPKSAGWAEGRRCGRSGTVSLVVCGVDEYGVDMVVFGRGDAEGAEGHGAALRRPDQRVEEWKEDG